MTGDVWAGGGKPAEVLESAGYTDEERGGATYWKDPVTSTVTWEKPAAYAWVAEKAQSPDAERDATDFYHNSVRYAASQKASHGGLRRGVVSVEACLRGTRRPRLAVRHR